MSKKDREKNETLRGKFGLTNPGITNALLGNVPVYTHASPLPTPRSFASMPPIGSQIALPGGVIVTVLSTNPRQDTVTVQAQDGRVMTIPGSNVIGSGATGIGTFPPSIQKLLTPPNTKPVSSGPGLVKDQTDFSGGLSIEPVYGLRAFKIDDLGRLRAINQGNVWRPGINESVCNKIVEPFPVYAEGDAPNRPSSFQGVRAGDLVRIGSNMVGVINPDLSVTYEYLTSEALMSLIQLAPHGSYRVVNAVNIVEQYILAKARRQELPEPVEHDMLGCSCGFYAFYDGSNSYHNESAGADIISGVIKGTGKTLIGSRGFRTSKAEILALCSEPGGTGEYGWPKATTIQFRKNVEKIRRNYPDVAIVDSFEKMLDEFPVGDPEPIISPETDPDFWTRA